MADLLRDAINPQTIIELGKRIESVYARFNVSDFEQFVNPRLSQLTLTERIELVADALEEYLPKEFEYAAHILINSLGEELDDMGDDPIATDLSSNRGFIVVALGTFISRNGRRHFEISMKALYEMTKRFSSEGPIRKFLINDEERTLALYHSWVEDPNVHVRRLVSESIRPRLPWTKQLIRFIEDPQPIFLLLNKLRNDPHLYVRRSVANNLNDISKDHPELVVATLSEWKEDRSPHMNWLIKHALRTLVKKGDPKALELLGFSSDFSIELESFALGKKKVFFGESLEFQLMLSSPKHTKQSLMIDYIIYHMKANGTLRPKVFKWTQKAISKEAPLNLHRKHPFKEIRTRKYYAGKHEIHIQINGKIVAQEEFVLINGD